MASTRACNKNKLYYISDCWSSDIVNFDFLWKSLGLAFPPHFEYDYPRKIFLMLYSIIRPNFFVWLPLLLEILDNICIGITCLPVCDALNFEINLNFFYQTVFPQTKKDLENGKSLTWNKKHFISFLKTFRWGR